jgi:hypothetical protein
MAQSSESGFAVGCDGIEGDIDSLAESSVVVVSIRVRRLGTAIRFYSSSHGCSSLSSDPAAETSLSWDPSVTMSLQLRHSIDGGVLHGMSSMDKVAEFDSDS